MQKKIAKVQFIFNKIFILSVRFGLRFLPDGVSRYLGKIGYANLIKESAKINFTANVFGTVYKINCQGNYAVERGAVAKNVPKSDPFFGISYLKLKDFILIDVGANIGAYSIGAVGIGANLVYAIEPGPLFTRLCKNIDLNSLGGQIKPIKQGLADVKGKMRWYEDLNNPGNAHVVSSRDAISTQNVNTLLSEEYVEVDITTLDELVGAQNIQKVDVLKIDVEGMEWSVISGGRKIIERDRPIIVAETRHSIVDMMQYDCLSPMFQYLNSIGYSSFSFDGSRFRKVIFPNFGHDTFFIPNQHGDRK